MRFKLSLLALTGLALFLVMLTAHANEPGKRGVGLWAFEGANIGLKTLGVSWFYTWGVEPLVKAGRGVEFVPMIWDEKNVNRTDLAKARSNGHILLCFNEPDHKEQASMSVAQALKLWPQLEATGMRLGSPAPASGAASRDSWLGRFMAGALAKDYRVDFICVHNYQDNYTDPVAATLELKQFLHKVYKLYAKPLWLTEFALTNWKSAATPEQQQAYMKEVLPMLESLPFVERYAWFALPPNPEGDEGSLSSSNLCDKEGKLNASGYMYRNTITTLNTRE